MTPLPTFIIDDEPDAGQSLPAANNNQYSELCTFKPLKHCWK